MGERTREQKEKWWGKRKTGSEEERKKPKAGEKKRHKRRGILFWVLNSNGVLATSSKMSLFFPMEPIAKFHKQVPGFIKVE